MIHKNNTAEYSQILLLCSTEFYASGRLTAALKKNCARMAESAEKLRRLEQVILDTGREERTLRIRSVKFFKKFVILGFEGLDRIEDVERLRGAELLIPREDAYPLEEGEYFIPDLIGLRVTTDDGRDLGMIKDVIETGANNVYDVCDENGKHILIPAIPDCILQVRIEEGDMTVHLLPGLENL